MNVVHWAPPPLQIWAPDLHRLQRLADFSRKRRSSGCVLPAFGTEPR